MIMANGHTSTLSPNSTHVPMPAESTLPLVAWILTIISSSLSIFGSIVIFWTFLRYRAVRNTTRRLLLFLTTADFMTAGGNLAGAFNIYYHYFERPNNGTNCGKEDPVCVTQSFWTSFSTMSSFFWTDAITIYFYVSIVSQRPTLSKKLLTPFHIICWGVPGAICLLALSFGALGSDYSNYAVSSGARCWISGCQKQGLRILWMLLAGKAWEIFTYLLSTVLIIVYVYQWKTQARQSIFDAANDMGANFREEDRNFFVVPLLLYVLRLWGTIRFFMASFNPDGGDFTSGSIDVVLLVLQCIGDSGQAFCNFILFCLLDKPVRQWMFRHCKSRPRSSSIQSSISRYGAVDNQVT